MDFYVVNHGIGYFITLAYITEWTFMLPITAFVTLLLRVANEWTFMLSITALAILLQQPISLNGLSCCNHGIGYVITAAYITEWTFMLPIMALAALLLWPISLNGLSCCQSRLWLHYYCGC